MRFNKLDAIASLGYNFSAVSEDEIQWVIGKEPDGKAIYGIPDKLPTEAEIQAEITRLEAEYEAQAYARSRAAEYPAIGDQLDALFHAGVFPAEMAAQIQAIKDKFPKE